MRKIIFRGKSTLDNQWLYGSLITSSDVSRICYESEVTNFCTYQTVRPESVGQYSGIQYMGKIKIFEGDIIKGKYYKNGNNYIFAGQVKFIGDRFLVVGIGKYFGIHEELHPLCEVIGNIYDNQEMLGVN